MDHLSAGHTGQWPDIGSVVWDALPGQDRTPPYRGCPCVRCLAGEPKGWDDTVVAATAETRFGGLGKCTAENVAYRTGGKNEERATGLVDISNLPNDFDLRR